MSVSIFGNERKISSNVMNPRLRPLRTSSAERSSGERFAFVFFIFARPAVIAPFPLTAFGFFGATTFLAFIGFFCTTFLTGFFAIFLTTFFTIFFTDFFSTFFEGFFTIVFFLIIFFFAIELRVFKSTVFNCIQTIGYLL